MGELGLAFIKLTKFENEEAMFNSQRVRAADMKCLATAAVKASRFYRELNAQTVKHLVMCKKLSFYSLNLKHGEMFRSIHLLEQFIVNKNMSLQCVKSLVISKFGN